MNTITEKEKNKNLNPWSILALQNIYKDIDEQFMQSFEAIKFLVKIKEKDFFEKFDFNLYLGEHKSTSSYLNSHMPEAYSYESVNVENKYNFNDFLIYKLIENFRRIYAIENKDKKPRDKNNIIFNYSFFSLIDREINPNNPNKKREDLKKKEITSLLEQQQNIYSIIEKTISQLDYQKNDIIYPKAVMGSNYSCSSIEIICYLGTHQSLQKENIPLHKKWFTNCSNTFATNDINHKHLTLFKELFCDNDKRFFINSYLKKLNINEVFTNLLTHTSMHEKYIISLIDIYSEENIYLKDEQKKNLLLKFFILKPMYFLEKYEIDSFEKKLNHLFLNFSFDTVIDKINVKTLNLPEGKWLLNNLKKSESVPFLAKTIFSDVISDDIKGSITTHFDFHNQELLKNIIDFTGDNQNSKEKITKIMNHLGKYMEKPLLAHIISKNTNFYEVIKPFYIKNKLNEILIKSDEEKSDIKKQGNKI